STRHVNISAWQRRMILPAPLEIRCSFSVVRKRCFTVVSHDGWRPWGDIHAGIHSLATIQRIGRGRRCPEHCFARLDLFPSFTAVEGCNGYGKQRWYFPVLRPTISGSILAFSY